MSDMREEIKALSETIRTQHAQMRNLQSQHDKMSLQNDQMHACMQIILQNLNA